MFHILYNQRQATSLSSPEHLHKVIVKLEQ